MIRSFALAATVPDVPLILLAPFAVLLLLMAAMPLMPGRARHAWEANYGWVSLGLAAAVAGYYLLKMPGGSALVAHTLRDYASFIALIGALFVVAGGVHLHVNNEATCRENVLFLFAGALLANVIGTTGASVVLIRPWIRMNQTRISGYHVVFFIFLVSNVGGALTPIGDPPLFLGYLRGVPFFWLVQHVWAQWLATVGLILLVFYVIVRRDFRRTPAPVRSDAVRHRSGFRVDGWANAGLLGVIVLAVFLPPRFFFRELVMLGAAAISLMATPRAIHRQNHFTFAPIREVAVLFAGIFVTMMPALNYLEAHGGRLGFSKPAHYYYATGGISAVLDNAPAYLNLLELAESTFAPDAGAGAERSQRGVAALMAGQPSVIVAISLGAVFFGAMTYIGNGPNFMVRSIAESAGVRCPGFIGYVVKYSLPILLPIIALTAWLFL
ncbi:MAG: sodium:proton antiporter [Verrucomicrobia bacterium]|nr:sodium:proton antiporter [Verrucomicrobiota bacterium]